MLCHQMTSTMKHKISRNYGRFDSQLFNILMLSIMWTMLFTGTMARPNIEVLLSNKPRNDVYEPQLQQQQQQEQDRYVNDMVANINNEKLFNKMQKYHHNQPNYLNNWPGLRNLVSNLDYDDNNGLEDSNEFLNTKFFDRLRQLASPRSDNDDDVQLDNLDTASLVANQSTFKDHNIKKNVQDMSPCHFKICNMGRKRDARFFNNN